MIGALVGQRGGALIDACVVGRVGACAGAARSFDWKRASFLMLTSVLQDAS